MSYHWIRRYDNESKFIVFVDFIKNADMMWKQSVGPSSIAAALAAKYLKEGGVITLPGAAPWVGGTAGKI